MLPEVDPDVPYVSVVLLPVVVPTSDELPVPVPVVPDPPDPLLVRELEQAAKVPAASNASARFFRFFIAFNLIC